MDNIFKIYAYLIFQVKQKESGNKAVLFFAHTQALSCGSSCTCGLVKPNNQVTDIYTSFQCHSNHHVNESEKWKSN